MNCPLHVTAREGKDSDQRHHLMRKPLNVSEISRLDRRTVHPLDGVFSCGTRHAGIGDRRPGEEVRTAKAETDQRSGKVPEVRHLPALGSLLRL